MNTDKYILTERGLFWLKIATVDAVGHDKLLHEEKIKFFDDNIEEWLQLDLTNTELLISMLDSPMDFINRIEDYCAYLAKQPINNLCFVDCSNQAIQLYGVLTGDLTTARMANLSGDNTKRIDGYQTLADEMNSHFSENIVTRNMAKKPLMTTLYGKQNAWTSMTAELEEALDDFDKETMDKIFNDSMMKIVPNAMTTMAKIQALNDKDIDTYYWTMPDGFVVKYDVSRERELKFEGTTCQGVRVHFETIITEYGGHKFNAGMAPNVIHSIDGWIARELKRRFKEFLGLVHDSYGTHYNFVDDVIRIWKEIMCEILNSNILEDIMEQIANGRPWSKPIRRNTLKEEHIMNSEYALA